jgi:hypothetical protein
LMQQEPENTTAQLLVTTPPSVNPPSIASERTDHQLELVCTHPTSPDAATGAVQQTDAERKLQLMLEDSKGLRKDAHLYEGNTEMHKLSSHIAYEHVTLMQQLSGIKDSVKLRPENAGGSTWTREVSSRGGRDGIDPCGYQCIGPAVCCT